MKGYLFAIASVATFVCSFAAPVADTPITTFFVASDTQGDLNDLKLALNDMVAVDPKYQALVINGDVAREGYEKQYTDLLSTLNSNPHPEKVFYNIGNHDLYSGDKEEVMFERFRKLTKEPKIYYERTVDGFPLIFLGTERYTKLCTSCHNFRVDHLETKSSNRSISRYIKGDYVWLSPEQLNWLKERLQVHSASGKPIFVYLHIPIYMTTSGSSPKGYENIYMQKKELLDILGQYSQVILFTSHTHYKLYLDDWQTRKTVEGGNPKGFQIINTGFIEQEWTMDSNGREYVPPGGYKEAQSLYLQIYKDRVVIMGRDHLRKKWVQKLELPYESSN
ncbi:uncharacterized protein VTP21DRAFT_8971 [Calcarisporiella thermophila]|uniref:uncharacterized protein n=1 Tax=Calcarisporiella thermophila TaxID=911321 RepID=UPI003742863B